MSVLEINRLLREDKWDVDDLAQEVYTILAAFDTGVNGPVKVNTPDNGPGMVFNMPADPGSSPIQVNVGPTTYGIPPFDTSNNPVTLPPNVPFNPNPGTPFPPPGFGSYTPPGGGGSSLPPVVPVTGGSAGLFPDPAASGNTQAGPSPPNPPSLPFTTVGQITGGSGTDYTARIYLGPIAGGAWAELPATALGLSASDTVEPLTWVYVTALYESGTGRVIDCVFIPNTFGPGTP